MSSTLLSECNRRAHDVNVFYKYDMYMYILRDGARCTTCTSSTCLTVLQVAHEHFFHKFLFWLFDVAFWNTFFSTVGFSTTFSRAIRQFLLSLFSDDYRSLTEDSANIMASSLIGLAGIPSIFGCGMSSRQRFTLVSHKQGAYNS